MKRITAFILILLLAALPLSACGIPEKDPEPDPPVVVELEPTPIVDSLTAEEYFGKNFIPTEQLSEEDRTALEAFRSEPKEPWGEKDFSLYNCNGEILFTAGKELEEYADMNNGFGELYPKNVNCVTYRGVRIGDNATEVFSRILLPKETIFVWNDNEKLLDADSSLVVALIKQSQIENISLHISIYFNEQFEMVSVKDVFPATELVDAQWKILIIIYNDAIEYYSAHRLHYIPSTSER